MPQPPLHIQVIQMASGFWISQAVFAMAELGLADHLAHGPRTAAELAPITHSHASTLHRLMRALTMVGLLTQDGERYALTTLGEALKSDAPGAARSAVRFIASRSQWQAWGEFMYSVRTGEPAFDQVVHASQFDFLAAHPEEARYFGETMVSFHGAEPAAVAAAYDFAFCKSIVDVGGGTGNLLTTILLSNPHLSGRIYDMAHAEGDARARIARLGLAARCEFEAGDFFTDVPGSADVYLLSHIIHDWNEDKCVKILNHCRAALAPNGRILIIEMVLPDDNSPHPGKMLDLQMLTTNGGQERTAQEYHALLAKASLKMQRVIPTSSAVGIVEATV